MNEGKLFLEIFDWLNNASEIIYFCVKVRLKKLWISIAKRVLQSLRQKWMQDIIKLDEEVLTVQ